MKDRDQQVPAPARLQRSAQRSGPLPPRYQGVLAMQRLVGNWAVVAALAGSSRELELQRAPVQQDVVKHAGAPPADQRKVRPPTAEERLVALENRNIAQQQEIKNLKTRADASSELDQFRDNVLARAEGWADAAKRVGSAYKTAANNYTTALGDDSREEQLELTIFASVLTILTIGSLTWLSAATSAGEPILEAGLTTSSQRSLPGVHPTAGGHSTAPIPGTPSAAAHMFDVSDVERAIPAPRTGSMTPAAWHRPPPGPPGNPHVPGAGGYSGVDPAKLPTAPGRSPGGHAFDVSDVPNTVPTTQSRLPNRETRMTPIETPPAASHTGAAFPSGAVRDTTISESLDLFPGAAGSAPGSSPSDPLQSEGLIAWDDGACYAPGTGPFARIPAGTPGENPLAAMFSNYSAQQAAAAASAPVVFAPGGLNADPQIYQNAVERKVIAARKAAFQRFAELSKQIQETSAAEWASFDPAAQKAAYAEWLAKAGLLADAASLPSEEEMTNEFERGFWSEHWKRQRPQNVPLAGTTNYPRIRGGSKARLEALGIAKAANLNLGGIEWFENGHLFEDHDDDDSRAMMTWAANYKPQPFGKR